MVERAPASAPRCASLGRPAQGAALLRRLLGDPLDGCRCRTLPAILPAAYRRRGGRVDAGLHERLLDTRAHREGRQRRASSCCCATPSTVSAADSRTLTTPRGRVSPIATRPAPSSAGSMRSSCGVCSRPFRANVCCCSSTNGAAPTRRGAGTYVRLSRVAPGNAGSVRLQPRSQSHHRPKGQDNARHFGPRCWTATRSTSSSWPGSPREADLALWPSATRPVWPERLPSRDARDAFAHDRPRSSR